MAVIRRPALLFHCQHSLGLGHLVRSLALAEALAERFRVVLLSGGRVPRGMRVPAGVELVELPAVIAGVGGGLRSADGRSTIERTLALRGQRVLAAFDELGPTVVLVELFPFGRKKLAGELAPLLERARAAGAVTACSVRDILVGRGERQAEHDLRASRLANQLLDLVLVHADPRLARLEDTFRPSDPLRARVEHTGFVTPTGEPPPRAERPRGVVVSAGGGLVGGPLLRAAVEAQRLGGRPMHVIAGPFLPEPEWRDLEAAAGGEPPQKGQTPLCGFTLRRTVPSLSAELAAAEASVSQCGYNTALDVLRSGVPALVVPFAAPGEDEQTRRAERLASLGAVRVLDPVRLAGPTLAGEIDALANFRPQRLDLDLDGARRSAELLADLAATASARARPAPTRGGAWLEPLRRALDAAAAPVAFFFRDDDAGWEDDRLLALLDLFAERSLPVDLGAIPRVLEPALARKLLLRVDTAPAPVGLHQHGLAHANHEPEGRKCEFGPSRSHAQQRRDIAEGAERLRELLGDAVQPIFTPPWNRCTRITGECLAELGFACLSRESGAAPLGVIGLPELSVSVDWVKRRKGAPLSRAEIGLLLAARVPSGAPVGVMFHHALMDDVDRRLADELLGLLSDHPNAECPPMSALVPDLAGVS